MLLAASSTAGQAIIAGTGTSDALVAPEATRADAAAWHAAVLIVALLMRAVVGRRRGLPWGFFEASTQHLRTPGWRRQP